MSPAWLCLIPFMAGCGEPDRPVRVDFNDTTVLYSKAFDLDGNGLVESEIVAWTEAAAAANQGSGSIMVLNSPPMGYHTLSEFPDGKWMIPKNVWLTCQDPVAAATTDGWDLRFNFNEPGPQTGIQLSDRSMLTNCTISANATDDPGDRALAVGESSRAFVRNVRVRNVDGGGCEGSLETCPEVMGVGVSLDGAMKATLDRVSVGGFHQCIESKRSPGNSPTNGTVLRDGMLYECYYGVRSYAGGDGRGQGSLQLDNLIVEGSVARPLWIEDQAGEVFLTLLGGHFEGADEEASSANWQVDDADSTVRAIGFSFGGGVDTDLRIRSAENVTLIGPRFQKDDLGNASTPLIDLTGCDAPACSLTIIGGVGVPLRADVKNANRGNYVLVPDRGM